MCCLVELNFSVVFLVVGVESLVVLEVGPVPLLGFVEEFFAMKLEPIEPMGWLVVRR